MTGRETYGKIRNMSQVFGFFLIYQWIVKIVKINLENFRHRVSWYFSFLYVKIFWCVVFQFTDYKTEFSTISNFFYLPFLPDKNLFVNVLSFIFY